MELNGRIGARAAVRRFSSVYHGGGSVINLVVPRARRLITFHRNARTA